MQEDKEFINYTILERVKTYFHNRMEERREMTKLKYFLDGKGKWEAERASVYMNKLTRKQASVIFKTRTRMIKVKDNFRNGHISDTSCRACRAPKESQEHALIIECRALPVITPLRTSTARTDRTFL